MKRKQFITGIHNYCDRWCERCPFSSQCSVFSEESKLSEEEKDMSNEKFWNNIETNLRKAIDMLHKMAEEHGIDLDKAAETYEEPVLDRETLRRNKKLETITRKYIRIVDSWFESNQEFFLERQEDLNKRIILNIRVDEDEILELKDALEVIRWYQMFISAKVHRSLEGLKWSEWDEIDEIQNDANGSAKVALMAIQRSMGAWETVRTFFPEKTDELIDIFLLLGTIQKEVIRRFPDAHRFIRPGFDEVSVH